MDNDDEFQQTTLFSRFRMIWDQLQKIAAEKCRCSGRKEHAKYRSLLVLLCPLNMNYDLFIFSKIEKNYPKLQVNWISIDYRIHHKIIEDSRHIIIKESVPRIHDEQTSFTNTSKNLRYCLLILADKR